MPSAGMLSHLRTRKTMIKAQKFALRREIKGGQFGVKKYKTSMVNKYSVEMLPMLTTKEIAELAAAQAASHSIDK